MKMGVDLKQKSTKIGIIIFVAGISSLILFFKGDAEGANGIISGAVALSGLCGVVIK